jgi:hypothetical protein
MSATAVVAGLTAREVSRRRTVVLLVVLLPLWFYLARRGLPGQSTRSLTLGIGWAVSTLTLFVGNAARGLDPRLRLTGASVAALVGGRLLAMTGAGVTLALGYWLMVGLVQDVRRPWAIGPLMLVSAVVAPPLGTLIGALLPGDLEGALALLTIVAVQMLADPQGTASRLMPFWSAREVGNYAIDATSVADLWAGLLHAGVWWLLATAGSLAIFAWRLRIARYREP